MPAELFVEERHRLILEHLRRDGRVSVKALSDIMDVSAVTIRSDLRVLEESGQLKRTYGGAVAVTPDWQGYRTLNRDEAVTLRYRLHLAGGAVVSVEETPEARPPLSGPPKLERKFAVSGIPAGTTVSLRLSGDAAWSTYAESWALSGGGALRTTAGVTYLDLAADGTATVTATWTP